MKTQTFIKYLFLSLLFMQGTSYATSAYVVKPLIVNIVVPTSEAQAEAAAGTQDIIKVGCNFGNPGGCEGRR